MIEDDDELAMARKQLALVEGIVESWRRELLPHNPKNFAIYAEGAIEEAEKLRAQVDDYLQRRKTLSSAPNMPLTAMEHPPTAAS